MVTTPGFSSRPTVIHAGKQLPQRDEAAMTASQPEIGFSNSAEAKDAPVDVYPEVAEVDPLDPGFTNDKAVSGSESKVVADSSVEDKSVTPAKKSAPRKK